MQNLILQDTIAAVASGDNGAIGIIRLSGSQSFSILKTIFHPKNDKSIDKIESYKMTFGVLQFNNQLIDEVLVVLFRNPKSYTGEDMVEISAHGGQYNLNRILNILLSLGARLAEKGEFTKRAFLNGKMDLTRAEAINELIQANNEYSHASSVNQLSGSLYQYLQDIKKKFIEIRAYFDVHLDYPEEDLQETDFTQFRDYFKKLQDEFKIHLKHLETSRLFQKGLDIVIAGKTNVGKSSLLNYLLQTERAIVSDEQGTTRDVVKEQMFLKNLPISIFDTAGLKIDDSHIDKKAISLTYQYINKAHFVIIMVDAAQPWNEYDKNLLDYVQKQNKNFIILINKIDLPRLLKIDLPVDSLEISLKEKINLKKIENFLYSHITEEKAKENFFVFSKRYEELFKKILEDIDKLIQSLYINKVYDMILYDLEDVFKNIDLLTGKVTNEDILDEIFGQFCVGK